jgi:hypothetical protein
MHIEDHDPLDRPHEAAKEHRNTRTWPRVQAIILAKQGDTATQIARALGVSRRTVQAWMAAYNRGGLAVLPDRPHPGRAPILPRDQEARFRERIEAPPRPEDGVCELRGAEIRRSSPGNWPQGCMLCCCGTTRDTTWARGWWCLRT